MPNLFPNVMKYLQVVNKQPPLYTKDHLAERKKENYL